MLWVSMPCGLRLRSQEPQCTFHAVETRTQGGVALRGPDRDLGTTRRARLTATEAGIVAGNFREESRSRQIAASAEVASAPVLYDARIPLVRCVRASAPNGKSSPRKCARSGEFPFLQATQHAASAAGAALDIL